MRFWIKLVIAAVMLMLLTVLFLSCTEENDAKDGDEIENVAGGESENSAGNVDPGNENGSANETDPSVSEPDINSDRLKEPEELTDRPQTDADGNEILYGDNDAQWKW